MGTKHMCFQGGCGVCLVEVKLYEPITQQKLSYAVNSVSLKLYKPRGEKSVLRVSDCIGRHFKNCNCA